VNTYLATKFSYSTPKNHSLQQNLASKLVFISLLKLQAGFTAKLSPTECRPGAGMNLKWTMKQMKMLKMKNSL